MYKHSSGCKLCLKMHMWVGRSHECKQKPTHNATNRLHWNEIADARQKVVNTTRTHARARIHPRFQTNSFNHSRKANVVYHSQHVVIPPMITALTIPLQSIPNKVKPLSFYCTLRSLSSALSDSFYNP
jgi:hypothetical protein